MTSVIGQHSPPISSASSRHRGLNSLPSRAISPPTSSLLSPHSTSLMNGHRASLSASQQHSLPPLAHAANPPPPPLTVGSGPPMQGPSVLQILSMGQERNHAADAAAHHPRIESLIKLGKESEATWLQIGSTAESLGDLDRAIASYESALRHNAYSIQALSQIATICRAKEDFKKAAEYFGRVVGIAPENGDVWGALGHCYLMIDDLKNAYSSYQQALYYMSNPNEPKLWYGIGILYDRYGSLEHAEEAFLSVIRMDPAFEKANEIFFRLGIIYKQQRKSQQSLECFRYILSNPPRPLTEIDIWFQIGHVYEQQKDFIAAKESYERVLAENPAHAKVLQQLGGLYHRSRAPFYNPDVSVTILTKSLESDANDPFSWYLLGRAYMTTQNFGKAYEAYQQAVYRDGKNPAFWCSIGVLYYNINQYHDALDAYSRAIRIHPYLSEVWFNLGALYESCNDQMSDAIDAYQRTLQLEPSNTVVGTRLREIREHQTSGAPLSAPPPPKDISPSSLSWSHASNTSGAPAHLAQTGLGPELSPALGRVPTANGTPQSPVASHRFEGPPPPQSTDPYRISTGDEQRRRPSGHGSHHSPSTSVDQSPRSSTHRLSGPSSAHLPQIKALQDNRVSPVVPGASEVNRHNSPLSPRTRHSDSAPDHGNYPPHGGYPSTSSMPPFGRSGPPGPEDMDWERSTGRNGSGSSANGGRTSSQSHRRSPPDPSQGRDSFPYSSNPNPNPYDRRIPSPGVGRLPATDDHDRDYRNGGGHLAPLSAPLPSAFGSAPAYHYGQFPGAGSMEAPVSRRYDSRDRETGDEEGRRSRGAPLPSRSDVSPRPQPQLQPASLTDSSNVASSAVVAGAKKNGKGAKKEDASPSNKREAGSQANKGGRKGRDSDGGGPVKKERKSTTSSSQGTPAAKRARTAGPSMSSSRPAANPPPTFSAPLTSVPSPEPRGAEGDRPSPAVSTASSEQSVVPQPIPASSMPSRVVDESYDEEYDEGVDALMGLATSGSGGEQSPPQQQKVSTAVAPLPPIPSSVPEVELSNPRKRSVSELDNAADENALLPADEGNERIESQIEDAGLTSGTEEPEPLVSETIKKEVVLENVEAPTANEIQDEVTTA